MGNRKLQFAVRSLQFQVAWLSNFSKAFIFSTRHVVFRQVEVLYSGTPLIRSPMGKKIGCINGVVVLPGQSETS